MRKIFYLLFIISCLILAGCSNQKEEEEIVLLEGVAIEIKEGTLTPTSAIITTKCTNKDNMYTFGNGYGIEKNENGEWKEVNLLRDNITTMEGHPVNKDNSYTQEINWEDLYGKLEPGKYRFRKYGSNDSITHKCPEKPVFGYIYKEFEIN